MSIRNLEALFQPRSIAVIGASDRPGSVGSVVLRNLKSGGFYGVIWPVNRRRLVDAAPAWHGGVAAGCARPGGHLYACPHRARPHRGTRPQGCAGGYRDDCRPQAAGGRGGTLEQAMLAAAQPYLLRILGPNCIGLLVPGIGLNASFAPGNAFPASWPLSRNRAPWPRPCWTGPTAGASASRTSYRSVTAPMWILGMHWTIWAATREPAPS